MPKEIYPYVSEAKQFQNLIGFFEILNQHSVRYVVLRNWDGLPNHVELGEHSDLDLLIDDQDIPLFNYLTKTVTTNRVMHITQRLSRIGDSFIKIDVRTPFDRYLPLRLAEEVLRYREVHSCFYIPRQRELFLSLLYHAAFQKPRITGDYVQLFKKIAPEDFELSHLHHRSYVRQYFTAHGYELVEPFDEWVLWVYRPFNKNYPDFSLPAHDKADILITFPDVDQQTGS